MNTAYATGIILIVAGAGLGVARIVSWRRANQPPVRLAIESGLTEADRRHNALFGSKEYAELYHKAGYAVGTSQRSVLLAAHAAGLVNEAYDPKAPWDVVRDPSYLDACAQVIHLDPDGDAEYHGLDRDNEADADAWIDALERAGHTVVRAQVALNQAYVRMINEEFASFDRAVTEAYDKVLAVGSREIIDWANDWNEYKRLHGVEVATIEMHGIREWIDNEMAACAAASIVAEMADGELDDEAASLTGTTQ